MTKNIYTLLVGINEYKSLNIPPLRGCVRDIEEIEKYLLERFSQRENVEFTLVQPKVLKNHEAARQKIIEEGFEQYLCQAGDGDVVLFYYAGHGSQEKAGEEFWSVEPDHLNETLVCYDSRTDGVWDLADKELRYLISKVAGDDPQRGPHVLVILDCCHSGSGTRAPEVAERNAPMDDRERPWEEFIFAKEFADKKAALTQLSNTQDAGQKKTGLVLPKGKHVLISACRDYETAKEYKREDSEIQGVLSYFFQQTLRQTNGSLSYQNLARRLNALVTGKLRDQSPQIEATSPEELKRSFLNGGIPELPLNYFNLTYKTQSNSWVIDGGMFDGIPKPFDNQAMRIAIFPSGSESKPELLRNPSAAIGKAEVTQVFTQQSQVKIIETKEEFSQNKSYPAIITSLPLKRLKIHIKGEAVGVDLVREAIRQAGPEEQPSLYVSEAEKSEEVNYELLIEGGQYWIKKASEDRRLFAPIPETPEPTGYTSEQALEAVRRLEHIARWLNVLDIPNPPRSRVTPDDIEMEFFPHPNLLPANKQNLEAAKAKALEIRLEYENQNGEWQPPTLYVKLTNRSDKILYCNILDLAEDSSINNPLFVEKRSVRLKPGESIEGEYIDLGVPDEFAAQGITEQKDIFKLLVSTQEFDASQLEQEGLELNRSITRNIKQSYSGILDSLLDQVNTRKATTSLRNYDDWATKEVIITVVRPQESSRIKPNQSTRLLDGFVELQRHPSLNAKVSLTTASETSRSIGNLSVPRVLLEDPDVAQPFQFTTSRGSDPGLSVLELFEVENPSVVTPEQPLELLIDSTLNKGEQLLAIAYDPDGEFFLPLSRGSQTTENGKTQVKLERLPQQPTATGRSFQGSFKIFFQKILSKKLGHSFDYPRLAIAEVEEVKNTRRGKPTYKVNYKARKDHQAEIKAKVADAQRILLYVHGIIGDTESMLSSIQQAKVEIDGQQRPLKDCYDLVLAFDYENLNTEIEENARLLGEELKKIGLEPNHGRQLHIVAHSMGGLVSRWFIEREGGNQVVQHLVMLGTPNGGSPWPIIQDWGFAMLGAGLNQLSQIVWPVKAIAGLLDFIDKNAAKALDQMQPDSEFLAKLANNPDPGVPYTIIAGDRSLEPAVLDSGSDKSVRFQKLVQKLLGKAVDRVVDVVFFQEKNDIAVHLTSIKKVSAKPTMILPDAACDHLTYFTTEAGLEALAIALRPAQR
jgi:triacylglycerol esterase/lipase EstA (alpha/beta hydrolase family)